MSKVNPILLREEVGRRLRAAREAAGLTLDDAAADLDVSKSTLSRIEKGQQRVNVHLVRSMMDRYDLRADDLLDKVRAARRRGWWKAYGISDRDFIALEAAASRVYDFEGQFMPGLLQTADYARAVFESGSARRSEDWITDQLNIRLVRQDRLTDEKDPLHLVAMIDEQALRKSVGGSRVMLAQLRHLALVSELPTVTLQVLPQNVVSSDAMAGSFVVLYFPEPQQPAVAYLATALGHDRKDRADIVQAARMQFERLRSLALDPARSTALIEQVADEMWSG